MSRQAGSEAMGEGATSPSAGVGERVFSRGAGIELLLVEDNPHDAELTLRALGKTDPSEQVFVAKDGAEALEFLYGPDSFAGRRSDIPPKLVLLDLKLPKVDGLEVLRRIKSDERTKAIPVVVLTSSREERDVSECYRLGVNSYIVKQVDFTQFTDVVSMLGTYWLQWNTPPIRQLAKT